MAGHIFDFQAYVATHKDPEARTRALRFGDYAYRGDIKYLRALHTMAPMRLVVEATLQLWGGWGRGAVLKDAVKASDREAARVYEVANAAARALHMAPVQIYVTQHLKNAPAQALGDHRESFVAVLAEAARSLDDAALAFVVGRALGHVQNDHVVYETAAFYADEVAGAAVRWAIRPGLLALNQWRQRATITADRAGLLACRALDVAVRQLVREAAGARRLDEEVDLDELAAALEHAETGSGWLERLLRANPSATLRIQALRAFATTQHYLDSVGSPTAEGRTLSEVDDEIDAMLRQGSGSRSRRRE